MDTASHDKVKRTFQAALEHAPGAARTQYLDGACADHAELRGRVEALLAVHDKTDLVLDRPVTDLLLEAAAAHVEEGDDDWLDFLAPPAEAESLGRMGHYEVLEVAGRGGMGIVFRAFDEKLRRVVAIKALAPSLAASPGARQQFVREARTAAAVAHENVIAIYAVEDAGPAPYFVMQFVDGISLEEKIRKVGPLPLKAIVRIGLHVAEGLAAAHRQGLVHRDVKPANILLENEVERVKITDFGLAHVGDDAGVTLSGLLTGTPTYMSPEQAQGEEVVDARSDLFSLGSVIYAMCTGEAPFRAGSTLAVLKRVCEDAPRPIREVNAELPAWLEDLVSHLHAKMPADRPASARDVADLLTQRLAELQEGAPAASGAPPSSQPRRRVWATSVAVLLVLLGGLVTSEATGVSSIRIAFTRMIWGHDATVNDRRAADATTAIAKSATTAVTIAADAEWERGVVSLPADEQARAVAARLKVRNPEFGGLFEHKVVDGHVVDFRFSSEHVCDISPVRALRRLMVLHCAGSRRTRSPLSDLSPLKGLRLEVLLCKETRVSDLRPLEGMPMLALDCDSTPVADLKPLEGMSLVHLVVSNTPVSDLSPIRGMPLKLLLAEGTAVSDLSPLEGMPLTYLGLYRTQASDLSPLKGMPLGYLNLTRLPVSDLSVLRGMGTLRRLVLDGMPITDLSALKGLPLEMLQMSGTTVSDLSPLEGMPLKEIRLDFQPALHGAVLRSLKGLERINQTPVAEVLKD